MNYINKNNNIIKGNQLLLMYDGGSAETIIIKSNNQEKKNENMEEKLNKFLEENNITVDENSNFEMYVVVDKNDKDHEVGAVIYRENSIVYTKEDYHYGLDTYRSWHKTKTISLREHIYTIKSKVFKVLTNKENVSDIHDNLIVNKYKVIEEIQLNPVIKFIIKDIDNENIYANLYNSIAEYNNISVTIPCNFNEIKGIEDIKNVVNNYLDEDERKTNLINAAINGVEV